MVGHSYSLPLSLISKTMNLKSNTLLSYDSDFESFESNLHAIIRARELGKNAALVPNLGPSASESHSILSVKRHSTRILMWSISWAV